MIFTVEKDLVEFRGKNQPDLEIAGDRGSPEQGRRRRGGRGRGCEGRWVGGHRRAAATGEGG